VDLLKPRQRRSKRLAVIQLETTGAARPSRVVAPRRRNLIDLDPGAAVDDDEAVLAPFY